MRRGPMPKPTVLRILQGNPGKKKLNSLEPMPAPISAPEPPEHLLPFAKEKWRELAAQLCRLRLLTGLDTDALELYCDAYAKKRDADQFLRERGMYFPILDESGKRIKYLQPYPQVSIADRCAAMMLACGDRLGLNPSARSRIQLHESGREQASAIASRLLGPR